MPKRGSGRDREQEIAYYIGQGLSCAQTAEKVGVSRQWVSRLVRRWKGVGEERRRELEQQVEELRGRIRELRREMR